jgi:hypothetical protein
MRFAHALRDPILLYTLDTLLKEKDGQGPTDGPPSILGGPASPAIAKLIQPGCRDAPVRISYAKICSRSIGITSQVFHIFEKKTVNQCLCLEICSNLACCVSHDSHMTDLFVPIKLQLVGARGDCRCHTAGIGTSSSNRKLPKACLRAMPTLALPYDKFYF